MPFGESFAINSTITKLYGRIENFTPINSNVERPIKNHNIHTQHFYAYYIQNA